MNEEYRQWLAGLKAGDPVAIRTERDGIEVIKQDRIDWASKARVTIYGGNRWSDQRFRRKDGSCMGDDCCWLVMPETVTR